VLKAVDEFVCMREIMRSVKGTLKGSIAAVLADVDLPYWTSKVEHIVAFRPFSATFLLCMRRNSYL